MSLGPGHGNMRVKIHFELTGKLVAITKRIEMLKG